MDGKTAINIIKRKFRETNEPVLIPLLREGFFTARLIEAGIEVDNLSNYPLLPWDVFIETINLLNRKGGRAQRGDAMLSRLGDAGLSLDSIEGHIASVVYGKQIGDSVFRRISPVAAILIWAGICESAPGELVLREACKVNLN
jgi:hypothetical protein